MTQDSTYIGDELTIFMHARNWKNYWFDSVKKHLKGDLLEVGAGIGVNTGLILKNKPSLKSITAIEPDKKLADQIHHRLEGDSTKVQVLNSYLADLPKDQKFGTIMYIDVIEHIEDDAKEMEIAKSYLQPGGKLIVLVPAYNFLFSPFDKAIGHYRRYNKKMLKSAVPKDLKRLELFYLDSLGVCASLANKYFLKQDNPTKEQITKYDGLVVPLSRISDKIFVHQFGKSLVGVWEK
jgi:SAM-dependent methyltransferase